MTSCPPGPSPNEGPPMSMFIGRVCPLMMMVPVTLLPGYWRSATMSPWFILLLRRMSVLLSMVPSSVIVNPGMVFVSVTSQVPFWSLMVRTTSMIRLCAPASRRHLYHAVPGLRFATGLGAVASATGTGSLVCAIVVIGAVDAIVTAIDHPAIAPGTRAVEDCIYSWSKVSAYGPRLFDWHP